MKRIILSLFMITMTLAVEAQTFREVVPIPCGDTALIGNLGYPTWNEAHILKRPAYGHALLLGDFIPANLLQYIAPPCFSGRDTVVIECARATQIICDTGVYIFEVECPTAISTVYAYEVECRDSVYANNLSGWAAPTLIQPALHGQARIILEPTDGAGVLYHPNPGFEGLDHVKVSLFQGQDTALFLFQVYCNLVSGSADVVRAAPVCYPNPVTDYLFLAGESGRMTVQVFDLIGRRYSVEIQHEGKAIRVDVRLLPKGIYILSSTGIEGVRYGVRFVKQ